MGDSFRSPSYCPSSSHNQQLPLASPSPLLTTFRRNIYTVRIVSSRSTSSQNPSAARIPTCHLSFGMWISHTIAPATRDSASGSHSRHSFYRQCRRSALYPNLYSVLCFKSSTLMGDTNSHYHGHGIRCNYYNCYDHIEVECHIKEREQ